MEIKQLKNFLRCAQCTVRTQQEMKKIRVNINMQSTIVRVRQKYKQSSQQHLATAIMRKDQQTETVSG